MEPLFERRKEQLLKDCQVPPMLFGGAMDRLNGFAEPFVAVMPSPESRQHAQTYIRGLLSDVERKNAESIAYRYDLDRQPIQRFIGEVSWDHTPLLDELASQVAREIGRSDAVLVFDPSAFPKKGNASVGVKKQWCGRLDQVANCQVGIYMAYVTDAEHALIDFRLYLPRDWAGDRKRRKRCGVPKEIQYRTRHELALEMLDRRGPLMPHGWIAGDDEMGRPARFRRALTARNERYLLAIPSNMNIRDLDAEPPLYSGRGRVPHSPFVRVGIWREAAPADAWTTITVRDGEKGPLTVEIVARHVQTKVEGRVADFEEVLVVTRVWENGALKHDYYLSNADPATPLKEFARVAKAEHRIEECLKRGKSETGLGEYQVRNWLGWHHHQALSLLASWFLVVEARRGKKDDARVDRPTSSRGPGADPPQGERMRHAGTRRGRADATPGAKRIGAIPLLQET
jgi:SRSO17 transposase